MCLVFVVVDTIGDEGVGFLLPLLQMGLNLLLYVLCVWRLLFPSMLQNGCRGTRSKSLSIRHVDPLVCAEKHHALADPYICCRKRKHVWHTS